MDNKWNRQWRTAAHCVKSTAGSCTVVGAACSTKGLESQQISVGVSYSFTRRTYLFAMYSELKNGKSARANATFNSEVSVGEDMQHFAIGLHHAF